MRFCLLLCCCAVALSASDRTLAVAPALPRELPPIPAGLHYDIEAEEHNYRLLYVADWHFANGRYHDALEAYTRFRPYGPCGHAAGYTSDRKRHRTALCYAHLRQHLVAVYVCSEKTGLWARSHESAIFLVQLYREAGQLHDLPSFLADRCEPMLVRYLLREEQRGAIPPWPAGVPKPLKGSLPKALPR